MVQTIPLGVVYGLDELYPYGVDNMAGMTRNLVSHRGNVHGWRVYYTGLWGSIPHPAPIDRRIQTLESPPL